LQQHLAFVDEPFNGAPPDLENAIYVSYLENVFVRRGEERDHSARSALSSRQKAALVALEEHGRRSPNGTVNACLNPEISR
jgi:hypothetical protein